MPSVKYWVFGGLCRELRCSAKWKCFFKLVIFDLLVNVDGMFIRKKHSTYKDRSYTNYQLVESVRTPKGPRQRVVCSLGDLKARSREEWLTLVKKVEAALVGQCDLLEDHNPEVDAFVAKVKVTSAETSKDIDAKDKTAATEGVVGVKVEEVTTEAHREGGAVHVGYQYWKKLGLDEILAEAGLDEHGRMLTCLMTLNRLVFPSSEHAMPGWIRQTAMADILGKDLDGLGADTLYRNLDTLHSKRLIIESRLAERERNLFNLDQTVFLYDLTSTYFEGQALGTPKAKRGYSRYKSPYHEEPLVGTTNISSARASG